MAAMAQEKSKTLHNFSLPSRLNWGNQKLLRCSNKLNSDHEDDAVSFSAPDRKRRHTTTSSRNASFRPKPKPTSIHRELSDDDVDDDDDDDDDEDDDDQIESIREKLIIDLRCEVDQICAAILGNSQIAPPSPPPPPPPPPPATAAPAESRPWNLRARKPVVKETPPAKAKSEHAAAPAAVAKRTSARCGGGEGGRKKFAVALTRQEIEEDFVKMAGKKPSRKPKKRNRNVQRQMDTLFPGLWLSEVNADMYKVNDNPESTK